MLIEKGCNIPIVLDSMDDEFDSKYAVWPERFFLASRGQLLKVFFPTVEFGFDMDEIKRVLEQESINGGLQPVADGNASSSANALVAVSTN